LRGGGRGPRAPRVPGDRAHRAGGAPERPQAQPGPQRGRPVRARVGRLAPRSGRRRPGLPLRGSARPCRARRRAPGTLRHQGTRAGARRRAEDRARPRQRGAARDRPAAGGAMRAGKGKTIRIVIADDHPILRDGLSRLLDDEGGFAVVGQAADGTDAVRLARELRPDVLLLDLAMPRASGLDALRELGASADAPSVLILTVAIEDIQLVEALQLGARGAVLKAAATDLLFKAIRSVVAGQYWVGRDTVTDIVRHLRELSARARRATPADRLSPRERQVIAGVASGESNRDIATRLGLSEDTIKHH